MAFAGGRSDLCAGYLKTAKNVDQGSDADVNYTRLMQDLEQAASLLTHAMFSSQASSKDGKGPQTAIPDDMLSWLNSPNIDTK
ncbi:MAG: hypothetical protein EXQ58_06670 [Acidobacteria bacterium]|nr:hypothetical protein [Acidobacteriota bacterium]